MSAHLHTLLTLLSRTGAATGPREEAPPAVADVSYDRLRGYVRPLGLFWRVDPVVLHCNWTRCVEPEHATGCRTATDAEWRDLKPSREAGGTAQNYLCEEPLDMADREFSRNLLPGPPIAWGKQCQVPRLTRSHSRLRIPSACCEIFSMSASVSAPPGS